MCCTLGKIRVIVLVIFLRANALYTQDDNKRVVRSVFNVHERYFALTYIEHYYNCKKCYVCIGYVSKKATFSIFYNYRDAINVCVLQIVR